MKPYNNIQTVITTEINISRSYRDIRKQPI